MKVHLKSILAEADLDAPPKSLFADIFPRVCKSLDLQETWYFGLCYQSTRPDDLVWLDTSRKVLKKIPAATKDLNFKIKYYPEDIGKELIENITIQIFYLEIKKAILKGIIYCPPDTAAVLAAYSLQVEYGNYNTNRYENYLRVNQNFLPRSTTLFNVDLKTWTISISEMWKKLTGIEPEDAMIEYLKLAQNLDMYGITYFNITNKKKTKLSLGVSALGLNIYSRSDKLTPRLSFSWSEIRKLKFSGKKFTIKHLGKKVPNILFHTMSKKMSKEILNLGNGNQELYVRRRKPVTPEILVLRERAKAMRELRQKRKDELQREVTFKETFLRREEEYHQQLTRLQEDLEVTVKRIHFEVVEKLEETKKNLQDELDKVRRDEEEYNTKNQKEEEKKLRQKARFEHEAKKEKEFEALFADENIGLPELVEVDVKLQSHLKSLRSKLEAGVNNEDIPELDRIHWENMREGRVKYRTLSDIKGENSIRRIRRFDLM